eukprot:TRINITY_DN50414_c1_g1_i1.p2 TRINITY_DN50414_c1_g1~~TRINITY_DN50414_c1_g1_i1.p2  ORF type:complete len:121 (-),score=3.43 TRINITY_DN50414_c1_g1_i1:68-385(-)
MQGKRLLLLLVCVLYGTVAQQETQQPQNNQAYAQNTTEQHVLQVLSGDKQTPTQTSTSTQASSSTPVLPLPTHRSPVCGQVVDEFIQQNPNIDTYDFKEFIITKM